MDNVNRISISASSPAIVGLLHAIASGVVGDVKKEQKKWQRGTEVDGKVHTWRERESRSFNRPLLCAGDIFPGHYCI